MRVFRSHPFWVVVLVLALLSFACAAPGASPPQGGGAKPAAEKPATEKAASEKPAAVELRQIKALSSTGSSGDAFRGGVDLFNERNTGKFNATQDQTAWDQLRQKELTGIMTGSAPYDVMAVNGLWVPGLGQYLEPLDQYLTKANLDPVKEYGAGAVTNGSFGGKIVALPVRFGAQILAYREDFFAKAGVTPPTNAQEFYEATKKLSQLKTDSGSSVYGSVMEGEPPQNAVVSLNNFFLPQGGRYLTPDFKHASPSIKQPFAIDILKFLKRMRDEQLVPNPLSWTYDDTVAAFREGRVGMQAFSSLLTGLIEDPAKSKAAGKLGYTQLPKSRLGPEAPLVEGTTWYFAIDKNSKNKDAAFEFLKFMTTFDAQKLMAMKFANSPGHIGVYSDPEFAARFKTAGPLKQVLVDGYVIPFPVPQQPDLEKIVHDELHLLWTGKSAEEVASSMFDQIEKALTR